MDAAALETNTYAAAQKREDESHTIKKPRVRAL